jgi:hypothetical protein
VLHPFGANPVVMTGSHNLGYKASHENDDNLMIVQGNAPPAGAYAANIIATYQTHRRWNAYAEAHRQDPQVWHGLVDSDKWQDSYLDQNGDDIKEILFWLGQHAASGAPPAPPPPPGPAPNGTPGRVVTATGPAPGSPRRPRKGPGKVTKRPRRRRRRPRSGLLQRGRSKRRR